MASSAASTTSNARKQMVRHKMLMKKYVTAKIDGVVEGFDIELVDESNMERYYILFKAKSGIYRDQWHIIEIKTKYGHGTTYEFPYQPPYVKFLTNVHHVNISKKGSICLDILKDPTKWSPTYDFTRIMINILVLFENPNILSPFNPEASRQYVDCERKFMQLKTTGMSLVNEEKLKDECFADFKRHADNYANTDLTRFVQWFPQITGGERQTEFFNDMKQFTGITEETNNATESTSSSTSSESKSESKTTTKTTTKSAKKKKSKWAKKRAAALAAKK